MTRMTGPDCVVMCNLINTHTHTHTHTQDLRPAQDLWSVFHPGPYGLWGIFRVTVCFGTIGEEGLLGNRWAHRWIQQTLEQY